MNESLLNALEEAIESGTFTAKAAEGIAVLRRELRIEKADNQKKNEKLQACSQTIVQQEETIRKLNAQLEGVEEVRLLAEKELKRLHQKEIEMAKIMGEGQAAYNFMNALTKNHEFVKVFHSRKIDANYNNETIDGESYTEVRQAD